MRNLFRPKYSVAVALIAAPVFAWAAPVPESNQTASCPTLLKQQFNRLQDNEPQSLCQYRGKVALVVNTASYCGFTKQYEGLEKLYSDYRDKGLVILGFPSNDFGGQEPGSNKEIADFCFNTYAVKFPMFAKSSVIGRDANPLFSALAESTGSAPKWNFYKYLIDRSGKSAGVYSSLTAPQDKKLIAHIERLLATPASSP